MGLLGKKISGKLLRYGSAEALKISEAVYNKAFVALEVVISDFNEDTTKPGLNALRYDIKNYIRASLYYESQGIGKVRLTASQEP